MPYGLEGDAEAAATVQRIYAEFTRLYVRSSLSEIAAGLNIDEIPTLRGGKWYAATVKYILSNAAYVPGVVDRETFELAQDRLQALRPGPPK